MADEQNEPQRELVQIRLDGSFGPGPMSELSIITKGEGGVNRTETFVIPYLLIDTKRLQYMSDMNFIVGFGITKAPDARLAGLRELGLS